MYEQFVKKLKRNPWKASWGIIPIIGLELAKNAIYSWADDRIAAGAGPVIRWIGGVFQIAIDHPVLSAVAVAALYCLGLVLFTFISVWIKDWKEKNSRRRRDKDSRLSEIDGRLASLDKHIRRVQKALEDSPTLYKFLFEVNGLISDIEQSITTFSMIRDMYGELSPVVAQPFSGWRLPSHSLVPPADDSIRDGEKWARYLEFYVDRANTVRLGWYGEVFGNDELILRVIQWRTKHYSTSADELLKLMRTHRETLTKMRQDYAAAFIADKLDNATIS